MNLLDHVIGFLAFVFVIVAARQYLVHCIKSGVKEAFGEIMSSMEIEKHSFRTEKEMKEFLRKREGEV